MYLFKLKAYLSSIKGNYIPRYKAQPSPEWPLSVGRCGGSASVCGCQNNYEAVSVCWVDPGWYPLFLHRQ